LLLSKAFLKALLWLLVLIKILPIRPRRPAFGHPIKILPNGQLKTMYFVLGGE
jgi:hypothetical protein